MTEPEIFDYDRFRDFLRDWFDHRKATRPGYSHRVFARTAGSRDPSLLLRVIKGQRPLPSGQVEPFCRALHLEGDAAEYFTLLVAYDQATDPEDGQRAWANLIDFHARRKGPNLDGDQVRFVSSWVYPAIYMMAECRGFEPDPAWIVEYLRPSLSEEEAAEALDLLFRLSLLERTDEGIRVHDPTIRTPAHMTRLGGLGYHRDNHVLAGEALDRIWRREPGAAQETSFMGMSVAIPSSQMTEFRKRVYEMQRQLMSACDAMEGDKDVVMQVNVQVFPVTEPLNDSD